MSQFLSFPGEFFSLDHSEEQEFYQKSGTENKRNKKKTKKVIAS